MSTRAGQERSRPSPQTSKFSRVTIDDVAASDRFDYWRHLFVGSYIDRPRSETKRAFRGELLGCADSDGSVFANLQADPSICEFGKRDSDLILLSAIHRGTFQLRQGDDAIITDSGNGLVLFDCDRPAVTSSTAYEVAYLAMPRSTVVAAMGGQDPTPGGSAIRFLPKNGLEPVLLAHMRAMAEHGASLDRYESATATKTANALAIALLAQLGRRRPEENEQHEDAFYLAARRYIELNCWRYDLTADGIAAAIGCSRAHLYRLFARSGQTVAGVLRDVRLLRARTLLETELSEPIGLIAFNTGYTDLSAFGKAFKRHFGMSPSECRALALASSASSA
jgi:AraC family transcriptional regulator, positive regulator of tynA and feaB